MKCDEVRAVFDAYLCGEASGAVSHLVEDHLAACPDCYEDLLCVTDTELDQALVSGWYVAEPPPGFADRVARRARLAFLTSGAKWLFPIWLMYTATVAAAGLWLALGESILGVTLRDIIGIVRTVRSVAQTLSQAFSLVDINETSVFLLALSCFVSLALIRYVYGEVLVWTKD
ncbi:MAG TPA: zf-HC2 domain-containing protein [Bacillota bacterium]|nr:zf-HC2 domain-containing protein [Bacillota bacterium]